MNNNEIKSPLHDVRIILTKIIQRFRYYKYILQGYHIDISTQMERKVNIDRINPGGGIYR